MVDVVEEDYRFETLPHTTGSDRAEMVGRKLKQHYRNTPYMAASLIGRDSGKRRDDRYLFSALTNAELINDWLQAVAARGLPVAGIYLLPMVSEGLLDRFGAKATNLLLVAQHPSGLRLTFFRDRQFRLSRFTRGDSGKVDNRTRYLSEEISNTRLYLHALRTMTLDEPITVLLVDHGDELAEAAVGVVRENPSLECVRLSRQELAGRLGIEEPLLAASPYVIYLHLLGLKAPLSNLAPPSVTVGYQHYRARLDDLYRVRRHRGRRHHLDRSQPLRGNDPARGDRRRGTPNRPAVLAIPGNHASFPAGPNFSGEPQENSRDRSTASRIRAQSAEDDGAREPGDGTEPQHRYEGVRVEVRHQ